MGAADRPALKAPPLPRSAARLSQRLSQLLGRRPGRSGAGAGGGPGEPEQDPLLLAGQRLRQAREDQGLGLRQLAQETRISTAVLEALERGWRDRLPEPAYLRTMLPLLEHRLALAPDSLHGALPRLGATQIGAGRESQRRRFTPGSIDVFTSWQGTLLYGLIIAALIHLLNLQQFRLASRGLLSSRPLPAVPRTEAAAAVSDAALLSAYPDLQPIARAARGQALRQLRLEGRGRAADSADLSMADLRLSLAEPTRVQIRGGRGGETSLEPVAGELTLPVLPPFRLELDPPPPAGAVRWRGRPLPALADRPGVYAYPLSRPVPPAARPAGSEAARPAGERPRP